MCLKSASCNLNFLYMLTQFKTTRQSAKSQYDASVLILDTKFEQTFLMNMGFAVTICLGIRKTCQTCDS